jgi:hypothetical protein
MKFWNWLKSLFTTKQTVEIKGERPNVDEPKKLLWYPAMEAKIAPMKSRGKYRKGYPEGAVVHFTAGRSLLGAKNAKNTVEGGIKNGFMFFVIDKDGLVYQNFPLSDWGYHAGTSSWPSLGTSVSSKLVGIEIANAGSVKPLKDKFVSWFGEIYEPEQVRHIKEKRDALDPTGYYHKYTVAQETSLISLLLWMHKNNPEVFKLENVIGHHECSPRRKNDPGGSLSMSMTALRAKLKSLI